MALDHFIPAGLIGRFSTETAANTRDRRVFVFRRGWAAPRSLRAEKVGGVNNLYDAPGDPIDAIWKGYESELSFGLDGLRDRSAMPLARWLTPLVTHITAMYVRGKEFDRRYHDRLSGRGVHSDFIQTKSARAIEYHKLLAPVMAARWVVMHFSHRSSLINNDLGFSRTLDSVTGEVGWAFPFDDRTLVGIFPRSGRAVATWRGDGWYANIQHVDGSDHDATALNEKLAASSTEFIFGSTSSIVGLNSAAMTQSGTTDQMYRWPFTGSVVSRAEHAWHQIAWAAENADGPEALALAWTAHDPPLAHHPAVPVIASLGVHHSLDDRIVRIRGNSIQIDFVAAAEADAMPTSPQQETRAIEEFTRRLAKGPEG